MKFEKGKSGNPNGRPKNSKNKTTLELEKILHSRSKELIEAAIKRALEGDSNALKLCLERILPPKKDSPISVELPNITKTEDLTKVSQSILNIVTNGEITPSEGLSLCSILEKHRSIVELTELRKDLDELKKHFK